MCIDDATFVFVDTETTGNRLIEMAAVKVRGGKAVDRFEALINPQVPISYYSSRLTGIRDHMVQHKPRAAAVLPKFLAFVSDAVCVMHNAGFDLRIINGELLRAGMRPLANETICTLRLARRLLKGLPSKSLASLRDHFGVHEEGAHRALADAEATFEVFLHLVDRFKMCQKDHSLEALEKFQRRTYRTTGGTSARLQRLRQLFLAKVPESPGVYFFRDRKGRLLYIGKAARLVRRVKSYFTGLEGKDARTRRLVRSIRSISWTETSTELEAILLEHRLRKEKHPPFNVADRRAAAERFSKPRFLRVGAGGADRRLTVVRHVNDDGAAYYGPFTDAQAAETIAKSFFHVYGEVRLPVQDERFAGLQAAHLGGLLTPHGLQEVVAFLRGSGAEIMSRLLQLMAEASDERAYERAAMLRTWMVTLSGLERRHFVTGTSVYERNAVIILWQGLSVEVHYVHFGRPVGALILKEEDLPGAAGVLSADLARHFQDSAARPKRFTREAIDEIRLLSGWLHCVEHRARIISWTPSDFESAVLEAVGAV